MRIGNLHETAANMAILLAHVTIRISLAKDTFSVNNTQERLVMASIKAFTRCFAAPGGLQRIGKWAMQRSCSNAPAFACLMWPYHQCTD